MIAKWLNPIYHYFYNLLAAWFARARKKRSERALAHLDNRLLEDVGLCRVNDDIVPIDLADQHRRKNREQRRKQRLRHRYVLRSRQE